MNLVLEKGERVTMGGKGRGKIGGKLKRSLGWLQMCLPWMAWGKRYGTFSGWGMAAGKVEVLLVVGGFDADGGAEARLVNKDVNIQEGDMGKRDGPGKYTKIYDR